MGGAMYLFHLYRCRCGRVLEPLVFPNHFQLDFLARGDFFQKGDCRLQFQQLYSKPCNFSPDASVPHLSSACFSPLFVLVSPFLLPLFIVSPCPHPWAPLFRSHSDLPSLQSALPFRLPFPVVRRDLTSFSVAPLTADCFVCFPFVSFFASLVIDSLSSRTANVCTL